VYPLKPASLDPAAVRHDASFSLTVSGCLKERYVLLALKDMN